MGISSLSAWENVRTPTLPSHRRLASYACFFATERSLEKHPHLVALTELTDEEDEARPELEHELLHLRDEDAGELVSLHQSWRFDDGAPTMVICSEFRKSGLPLGPLNEVDNVTIPSRALSST